MTDLRVVMGFDIGDLVQITRPTYNSDRTWEVVDCDLRTRKFTLQREMHGGKLSQCTAAPRHLVLIKTAEERVAETLMEDPR